ncbi:MAG: hypothetical protein FVQ78_01975 [Solirubrobacterales bacterium]|nr:hypothetical protein [Solirubrobacterales bacterium]
MSQAVAAPTEEPPSTAEPALVFDQLYRDSRDDVYAYAAGKRGSSPSRRSARIPSPPIRTSGASCALPSPAP